MTDIQQSIIDNFEKQNITHNLSEENFNVKYLSELNDINDIKLEWLNSGFFK